MKLRGWKKRDPRTPGLCTSCRCRRRPSNPSRLAPPGRSSAAWRSAPKRRPGRNARGQRRPCQSAADEVYASAPQKTEWGDAQAAGQGHRWVLRRWRDHRRDQRSRLNRLCRRGGTAGRSPRNCSKKSRTVRLKTAGLSLCTPWPQPGTTFSGAAPSNPFSAAVVAR